jgi:hypothetical protein
MQLTAQGIDSAAPLLGPQFPLSVDLEEFTRQLNFAANPR